MLHLTLLGEPRAILDGRRLQLPAKGIAILAYLAISDRPVNRREIATLLWPNSHDHRTRLHSLSQLLYAIKTEAGREIINKRGSEIVLPPCFVDVVDLRRAVLTSNFTTAATLFRPFLSPFESGSAPFDQWSDQQRVDLENLCEHEVLPGLAAEGDWEQLLKTCCSLLSANRYNRQVWEWKIRAQVLTGNEADARASIEEASSIWASELELHFPLNFDDVAGLAGTGRCATESGAGESLPFVGRRDEIAKLTTAWGRARSGTFSTLIISGESGIGKTALLDRVARLITIRGGRALTSAGYALEKNVPLGIFSQLLRQVPDLPAKADLSETALTTFDLVQRKVPGSPDPRVSTSFDSRQSLLAAGAEILFALAQNRPLAISIDDVQWADITSLELLHFAARQLKTSRILLILSRTTPTSGEDFVKDWADASLIGIGPLSTDEVAHALRSKDLPDFSIEELRERTGGNPLLLSWLFSTGGLTLNDDIPANVVDYFRPKLEALSVPSHLLLASFATTSAEIPLATRQRICGFSGDKLARAVFELRSKELLTSAKSPRPSHGLLGEVALAALDPANERALRGRVARILAEDGLSPPAALAAQFDFAGNRQKAYEAAVQAANGSRDLHAAHEAEFFIKIALANAPNSTAETKLRIDLAETLGSTGRFSEAKASLESVDDLPKDAPADLRARFRAVDLQLLLRNETSRSAISAAWDFLDSPAHKSCPKASAELLLTLGSTAFELGLPEQTLRAVERVRDLAQEIPDGPARASALARVASAVALVRSFDEGLQAIDELLEDVRDLDEWPPSAVGFHLARGSALTAAGKLIQAEADFRAALQLMESHGLYDRVFQVRNNLGVCLQEQGRYSEAHVQFAAAARISDTQAAPNGSVITTDNLAILNYESGDYREAYDLAGRALRSHGRLYDRSWFTRLGIRGLAALALNDTLDARECFREAKLGLPHLTKLPSDVSYIEIFIARMLLSEGDRERAKARLSAAIRRSRPRELLSSVRMEIEKLELERRRNPIATKIGAAKLREMLADSGAAPLLNELELLENQRTPEN